MLRIATAFVDAGVNKIRLTGGEPAVRKDLVDVVAALDGLRPRGLDEISITSNGLALAKKLPALQAAGLDRLNVSLDTLEREKFNTLTRRDALPKVLETIDQALGLGLPLKVNCVLMRGTNEDEVLDFAAMTAARPLDVRFIEYMPFDGNRWEEQKIVPYAELLAELKGAHPEVEPAVTHAHDVARTLAAAGRGGDRLVHRVDDAARSARGATGCASPPTARSRCPLRRLRGVVTRACAAAPPTPS